MKLMYVESSEQKLFENAIFIDFEQVFSKGMTISDHLNEI